MISPGGVYYFRYRPRDRRVDKMKYAICVHVDGRGAGFFLFINTDPPYRPDAGVAVGRNRMPYLKHDSFVNTGQMVRLGELEMRDLDDQLTSNPPVATRKGGLPQGLAQELRNCADGHGALPGWQRDLLDQI